jgi:Cu+-exporting ATPase
MKKTDIKEETIEYDILGMSCINCANSIKTYLEKREGVNNVDINYTSEIAVVKYDPDIINDTEIKSDIKKLGYDVLEEDEDNEHENFKKKQLKIQKYKIIASIFLTLLIVSISMKHHFSFINISIEASLVLMFIFSTVQVFWCGDKFLKGAITAFRSKTSDMNSLITLGVLSSYIYSILISFNHLLGLNIKILENSHEVYFETAAMIITFILIGNYLEAVLKSRTQTSIKKLKDLQSKFVTVIRQEKELLIPYKKVKKGDIVLIKAGDKIPVDGQIIEGYCVADESAMTGESLPVERYKGDNLLSGTILISGFVKLKAIKVGKDTYLSKIINLVKDASNSKPKIQRFADKIAAVFVPVVLLIAAGTFLIWYLILNNPFDSSLLYAVSVLIIACPCALGLASPMAVVIGVGRSAENGILFNNVEAIERLNKVDTICFDKTGTLTTGQMRLKEIKIKNNITEKELLSLIFSVEKLSNHPIAKSIVQYCIQNDIDVYDTVTEFENEEGGISAKAGIKKIIIGNERYIKQKIKFPDNLETTANNKGILYIGIDNEFAGYLIFEDSIKPESRGTIKRLKEKKLDIFMISGDNEETTKRTAEALDIEKYSFKTLPDEKEKIISGLQAENKSVAMVGDGINDAPSLARANVGIAIGTGQDIAVDSADVILVKGDLQNLTKAIIISGKTVSIIKQNIFWAFFYNIIAIPLAAGLLVPYGIIISPVMAAMLMAFSDVITVIGNSLRLKYVNIN